MFLFFTSNGSCALPFLPSSYFAFVHSVYKLCLCVQIVYKVILLLRSGIPGAKMKTVLLVLIVANALWLPILACINVQVAFEQIMPFAFTPNASVRLKCDVNMLGDIDPTQGNFSVRVDWFRNGKPLPIASSSSTEPTQLIASSCNNETAAWYGCIVRSKYGTLKVPEVPTACKEVSRPRLLLHHGTAALTSPGSLVMLECRVDRLWSPLLELPFVWTLNGTPIPSESNQALFAARPCRDLRPKKAPS